MQGALKQAMLFLPIAMQVRNPGLDLSGPRAEVIPTIAKLLQEDEQRQQHQI